MGLVLHPQDVVDVQGVALILNLASVLFALLIARPEVHTRRLVHAVPLEVQLLYGIMHVGVPVEAVGVQRSSAFSKTLHPFMCHLVARVLAILVYSLVYFTVRCDVHVAAVRRDFKLGAVVALGFVVDDADRWSRPLSDDVWLLVDFDLVWSLLVGVLQILGLNIVVNRSLCQFHLLLLHRY